MPTGLLTEPLTEFSTSKQGCSLMALELLRHHRRYHQKINSRPVKRTPPRAARPVGTATNSSQCDHAMSKNFSYEDALTPPNAGGAFSYEDATGEKPKRTWGEAIKDTGAQLAGERLVFLIRHVLALCDYLLAVHVLIDRAPIGGADLAFHTWGQRWLACAIDTLCLARSLVEAVHASLCR